MARRIGYKAITYLSKEEVQRLRGMLQRMDVSFYPGLTRKQVQKEINGVFERYPELRRRYSKQAIREIRERGIWG